MPVFDKFKPGQKCPESALYYCMGCGEVIPLAKENTFPPCGCGNPQWLSVAIAGEAGEIYGIGKDCPQSGLYICRDCFNQVIPLAKGDNFPPCRTSGDKTAWQIIVPA